MLKKIAALSFVGLLASAPAHATTLIYDGLTDPVVTAMGGQGFGNTFTVLTIQQSTSPESGCIAPSGSGLIKGSSACGGEKTLNGSGTLVTGGQEANPLGSPKQAAPTLSQLGITSGNQVGVIWNGGSPGSANLDIPDVSVKLYDANDNLLLVVSDAFSGLDPYPGQGNSGWLITLNSASQTAFNNLISGGGTFYLALDSTFSWPDGSGGSAESYQLTNINPSTPVPTPEPSSLALLGTGIVGAATMLRRRLASLS